MVLKNKLVKLFFIIVTASFLYCQQELPEYARVRELEKEGKYTGAIELLKGLITRFPTTQQYQLSLANIYIKQKQFDEAVKSIENLISLFPDEIYLYGELGSVYHQWGKINEANKIWMAGINRAPEEAVNYRVLSNYAIRNRSYEIAIEMLEKAYTLAPKDNVISEQLASLYFVSQDFKKAALHYCRIVENNHSQSYLLINSFAQLDDNRVNAEQFLSTVEEYYNNSGNSIFLSLLKTFFQKSENWKKYLEYIIKSDKLTHNPAEIIAATKLLAENKCLDEAGSLYEYVKDNYEKNEELINIVEYYRLKTKLLTDGNIAGRELKNLEKAFEAIKDQQLKKEILILLARLNYSKLNKADRALYYLGNEIINKNKDDFYYQALLLKCEIFIKTDRIEETEKLIERTDIQQIQKSSERNGLTFLKGQLSLWKKDYTFAEIIFDSLSKNYSDEYSNNAIENKLFLTLAAGDTVALSLFGYLDRVFYSGIEPDSMVLSSKYSKISNPLLAGFLMIKTGEYFIIKGNFAKAEEILAGESLKENVSTFFDKVLYLQAKIIHYGYNRPDDAINLYRQLMEKYPESIYCEDAKQQLLILTKSEKK